MRARLVLTAMVAGASVLGSPSVTSLITMPIADILGHREAEIDWTVSGSERRIDPHYWHAMSVNVGIADRMELSVENDFLGTTTFHAKLSLYEQEGRLPFAVSAGVLNFEGKHRADAFVASRFDFKRFRLHAAWVHDESDHAMIGVDFAIRDEWTGALEYDCAAHGYTWGALTTPIARLEGVSLTLAAGFPKVRADGIQHYALLAYGFRF